MVLYFTGTGNSRYLARRIAEGLEMPLYDLNACIKACLSVPGRYGMVKRPEFVRLRAQDRDGNWFEAEGEGLTARCFVHECDHLDGHIYTERAYHMLTDEEMAELEEEA